MEILKVNKFYYFLRQVFKKGLKLSLGINKPVGEGQAQVQIFRIRKSQVYEKGKGTKKNVWEKRLRFQENKGSGLAMEKRVFR